MPERILGRPLTHEALVAVLERFSDTVMKAQTIEAAVVIGPPEPNDATNIFARVEVIYSLVDQQGIEHVFAMHEHADGGTNGLHHH